MSDKRKYSYTDVQTELARFVAEGRATGVATLLPQAAANGELATVDRLLLAGVDINARDADGNTALHLCSKHSHLDVAQNLLDNDADVNAVNNEGLSALAMVARDGHVDFARFLIDHGADVNLKDHRENAPWHYAAAAA